MSELQQKLSTAKKGFRARLLLGRIAVAVVLAMVPLIYFTHIVALQITPRSAAINFSAAVESGNGVVVFDSLFAFGARAVVRVESPGFIAREVAIDFSRVAERVLIEMHDAPVMVTVTTDPPLAQTRWRIDGVYVATGAQLSRAFQPGAARVEAEHEFYRAEVLQLEVRAGDAMTHRINLSPVIGAIDIDSEPDGAAVFIDGDEKGVTPIQVAAAGGVHRARVALPGFAAVEEDLVITARAPTAMRDYRLAAQRAPLRVNATPDGGALLVDGVLTNAAQLSLAVGSTHTIAYQKPGYFSQTKTVLAKTSAPATVSFALKKEMGEVIIRSTPRADLFINGAAMGVTPQTILLQALPQKIKLTRADYRGAEFTVMPSASAPLLIERELQTELMARLTQAAPLITVGGGIKMKLFDPRRRGRFSMGAPSDEAGRRANEFQRAVALTKPFYVSVAEITEEQFAEYKPTPVAGKHHPVRDVSWLDAAGFANWMSARDGLAPAYQIAAGALQNFDATADGYRLPSEAEWEWLARVAGHAQNANGAARFVWGDDDTVPKNSGNFADESAKGSVAKYIPRYRDGFVGVAPVASFAADAAGLHDVAGNVSEWVHDVYDLRPPTPGQVVRNPFGPRDAAHGDSRVVKGASFRSATLTGLRASFREGLLRGRDDVGFRVARYLYGKEE